MAMHLIGNLVPASQSITISITPHWVKAQLQQSHSTYPLSYTAVLIRYTDSTLGESKENICLYSPGNKK